MNTFYPLFADFKQYFGNKLRPIGAIIGIHF